METVKDCSTCYWNGAPTPLGSVMCDVCSLDSTVNTPYPHWTDLNDSPQPITPIKRSEAHTSRIIQEMQETVEGLNDVVNHPKHYTVHPSGVECIQITEHMNFCLGNAMKYIWRAGDKHDTPLEDLKKAKWYIEREIKRLENNE